jgi:iron(III) transport system substrate-binding protein
MVRPTAAQQSSIGENRMLLLRKGHLPRWCKYVCALAVLALSQGIGASPIGTSQAADAKGLTLYNAQHEQMVDMLIAAFTKETGIEVRIHSGEPPELANQIIQEGSASPADVYFTANSPELMLLDEKGLLAKVDRATLAKVPSRYSAPDGSWVGVLARENVLTFNTTMIEEGELPASLLDLAKPEWKGKLAIAPTDADFLPLVSAIKVLKGKQAALDWLRGLKQNSQIFDDNEGVMAAVDRGAVATGIVNNYYWAHLRVEKGADKLHSQIHHFSNGDAGALINVSGAGVLKSSSNQEAAQRFLAFLVSKPTQEIIARTDVSFEYPLVPGVAPNELLRPFNQLQPPQIGMSQLGDDGEAAELLRQAGLL